MQVPAWRRERPSRGKYHSDDVRPPGRPNHTVHAATFLRAVAWGSLAPSLSGSVGGPPTLGACALTLFVPLTRDQREGETGSTRTEFSLVSDVSGGAHSRPAAITGDARSASDRARPAAAVGRRLCRSRSWRVAGLFRVKLSSIVDADLMPNRRATQASEHYDSTPGTSARADDTKWMLAHFM